MQVLINFALHNTWTLSAGILKEQQQIEAI